MEITIYAKKRTTSEGRKFYTYLTTLTKKNGEDETVSVKFKEECGAPKPEECPCNIIIDRETSNFAKPRKFTIADTGEVGYSRTLWVSDWSKGSKYVDTSWDEFEYDEPAEL